MSTISPVFSSEPVLASHVPVLDTGFAPWDASDFFSVFDSLPPVYSINVNPGLEKTNSSQIQVESYHNLGLKDKPMNRTGSNGVVFSDKDERRKRQKISNRESAQRSRRKKQKQLEDVRSELNQLKNVNREFENRVRYVLYHSQRATVENDRLRLEHDILHEKLLNLRQALMLCQIRQSSTCATWTCIDSTVVTVQRNPSMIN